MDAKRESLEVHDAGVYEHTPRSKQEADKAMRLNATWYYNLKKDFNSLALLLETGTSFPKPSRLTSIVPESACFSSLTFFRLTMYPL